MDIRTAYESDQLIRFSCRFLYYNRAVLLVTVEVATTVTVSIGWQLWRAWTRRVADATASRLSSGSP